METSIAASKSMKMAKETLEAPHRIAKAIDEVAKMVGVGCGTIAAIE